VTTTANNYNNKCNKAAKAATKIQNNKTATPTITTMPMAKPEPTFGPLFGFGYSFFRFFSSSILFFFCGSAKIFTSL